MEHWQLLDQIKNNPYLLLSEEKIVTIGNTRDIRLIGSFDEKCGMLFEYDKIMPDYITTIYNTDMKNVQGLKGTDLFVYAALRGINTLIFEDAPSYVFINFIRARMLMMDKKNQYRAQLPLILDKIHIVFLETLVKELNVIADSYLFFLTKAELIDIIIKKHEINIQGFFKHYDFMIKRYDMLRHHPYSHLIDRLYNINGKNDIWISVAKSYPCKMENIIIGLGTYTLADLATSCGMVIPLRFENTRDQYIEDNILSYESVFTRPDTFSPRPLVAYILMDNQDVKEEIKKMTDTEIFTHFNVYIPYSSRDDLVRGIAQSIIPPLPIAERVLFFYPCPVHPTRSINKTTVTGNDITDNVFFVAYGRVDRYLTYDLMELYHSFYEDVQTGNIIFRMPHEQTEEFHSSKIRSLLELLRCFPSSDEIVLLMERITIGLNQGTNALESDRKVIKKVRSLSEPMQEHINAFLTELFYTGMYMRRWKGPGHPYPMNEEMTTIDFNPQINVTENINKGLKILEKMDNETKGTCMNLRTCEFRKGEIEAGAHFLEQVWQGVMSGKMCIRQYSTVFIGTAHHYLLLLHKTSLFDIHTLDRVF